MVKTGTARATVERARRENEAGMQAERDKVAGELRDLRAEAETVLSARADVLDDREKRLAQREQTLRERAAQLRAALGS